MGLKKATGKIKRYDEKDVIVGAWISEEKLEEIEAEVGDFIYAQIGWSGSLSCRAVIKGILPQGYESNEIAFTSDCMVEGNFKEGQTCKFWKHTSWF